MQECIKCLEKYNTSSVLPYPAGSDIGNSTKCDHVLAQKLKPSVNFGLLWVWIANGELNLFTGKLKI